MVLGLSLFSAPAQALYFEYPERLILIQNNTLKSFSTPQFSNSLTLGMNFSSYSEVIDPERINSLIDQLGICESGNNQLAINPVDKDGTPSCGRFQFKRLTWKYYIIKYNLFGWQNWEAEDFENALWSGDVQKIVVEKMFVDPDVNLLWEFPDCSKKLNLEKNYAFK